jgi:hypothetical protein
MQLIDKYLPYWPIIAASILFLAVGLWWRLSAARAMELTPKDPNWVKRYRAGGFPFRRVLPAKAPLPWWALVLAVLLAAAFTCGKLANIGMIYTQRPDLLIPSRYALLLLLLHTIGGCAVYLLLHVLFSSVWISLPGALLFAASASQGHAEGCLLAVSLLFLLLYLRAEKPGFPAELLYLCAIAVLASMIALRPALVWLLLCFPPVHWYKLNAQRRERKLTGGQLFCALLAALVIWALVIVLASVLRRFQMGGFRLSQVLALTAPARFRFNLTYFLKELRDNLFSLPTRGMTIDLMVDAPLFGFGLWGCCSAWRLGKNRRDARGVFILLVFAALLIVWLVTGRYTLTLGLTLTAACILHDADLGRKRADVVLLTAAGICWYIVIQLAAWYIPLTAGLQQRLV